MSDKVFFTAHDGVRWSVSEDGADTVGVAAPRASSAGGNLAQRAESLRFESDLEVRLLWSYPDDWRRLSPSQLESMCERANTVIARFPRGRQAGDTARGPFRGPPTPHR